MPSLITRGAISVKSLGFGGGKSISYYMGYAVDGAFLRTYGVTNDKLGYMYIYSGSISYYSGTVMKLDELGVRQWHKRFNSSSNVGYPSSDILRTMASDSSNNVYLVGDYTTAAPFRPVYSKINSSGSLQIPNMISTTNSAYSMGMYIDGSNNIYVAYKENVPSSGTTSGGISKFNSSGTIQWTRAFDDTSSYSVQSVSVTADGSGNVYAGHYEFAYSYLHKFNSAGTFQWSKEIVGSFRLVGVGADSAGNVYLINALGGIIKIDANGTILWQKEWTSTSTVQFTGFAIDGSDNIYISGTTPLSSVNNSVIIKYNSSGVVQWQRRLVWSGGLSTAFISADADAIYLAINSADQSDGMFFAKLPTDGSKTGTYTIGARSYTYAVSSLTETTGSYSISAKTLTQTSPSYSSGSSGATLTNTTYPTQQATVI